MLGYGVLDTVEKIHINTEFGDEFDEVDIVKDCLNEIPLWHKVGLNANQRILVRTGFTGKKSRF